VRSDANLGATDNAVLDAIASAANAANNKFVTGTVIGDVNLGATDNAVLDAISSATAVINTAIAGSEMQVDVITMPSVTVDLGANNDVTATGNVANDAVDSGSPVKIGAHATNSVEGETQVANNDRVDVKADLNGVLLARPHTTLEEILSTRILVSTSVSTVLTAFTSGGAGIHNYITTISVSNVSSVEAFIDISDASASANGPFWSTIAPIKGGSNITFDPPLKQPTANTPIHVKADVSVDSIFVCINGFQAQG